MLRARSGRPSSPRAIAQRRLHLQQVGIAPGGSPRRPRFLRARRDAVDGLAHDRDPRVAVAHESVEVALVQRAADPQRDAARLHRLRVAVDVAERQRRRVEGGRRVAPEHLAGRDRVGQQLTAPREVERLRRRTPRVATRYRRRDRADPATTRRASRPASRAARRAASGAIRMPVASRIRVVTAAIAASTVSGSSHGASGGVGNLPHEYVRRCCGPITTWSTTTIRSTPASSATRARSTKRCHSPSGKNEPKFGRPTVRVGRAVIDPGQSIATVTRRWMSRDDVPMRSSNSPGSTVHSCAASRPRTRTPVRRAATRPSSTRPGRATPWRRPSAPAADAATRRVEVGDVALHDLGAPRRSRVVTGTSSRTSVVPGVCTAVTSPMSNVVYERP